MQHAVIKLKVGKDGLIWGVSPYREELLKRVRNIPTRRFDRINRVETFKPVRDIVDEVVSAYMTVFGDKLKISSKVYEATKGKTKFNSKASISVEDGEILISTPYSEKFIYELKNRIPPTVRKWNKLSKVWVVDAMFLKTVIEICQNLWEDSVFVSEDATELFEQSKKIFKSGELLDDKGKTIRLEGGTLRPYQSTCVRWSEHNGSGIIADAMGLGKTVEYLGFTEENLRALPGLVICPASVKLNWAEKIKEWTGKEPWIIAGQQIRTMNELGKTKKLFDIKENGGIFGGEHEGTAEYVICNYELIETHLQYLRMCGFKSVAMDEGHMIKNPQSKRSMAVASLVTDELNRIKHRFILTGTPMLNRPRELWNLLHLIDPEAWEKQSSFLFRYCQPKRNGYGWNFDGSSNVDELRELIFGKYMIRRNTLDVLKDMPLKNRSDVTLNVDSNERKEYDRVLSEYQNHINTNDLTETEHLSILTTLRKTAGESKVDSVFRMAKEYFADDEATPLVIFAHHKSVIKALYEQLSKDFTTEVATGDTSIVKRQEIINRFKEGKIKILIASIMAMGTGVDGLQQSSSNMWFVERTWRPSDLSQAEDRIWRMGQTETCNIQYLDMANSIDMIMRAVIKDKQKMFDEVIDGESGQTHDTSVASDVRRKMQLELIKGEES